MTTEDSFMAPSRSGKCRYNGGIISHTFILQHSSVFEYDSPFTKKIFQMNFFVTRLFPRLEWLPGTSAGGGLPGTCPCGRSVSE
jgi:hypothetical protein